jgi:hypothetical protein
MESKRSAKRNIHNFKAIQVEEQVLKSCSNPDCPNDNPQPISNFARRKSSVDGRRGECRDCLNKRQREGRHKRLETSNNLQDLVYRALKEILKEELGIVK